MLTKLLFLATFAATAATAAAAAKVAANNRKNPIKPAEYIQTTIVEEAYETPRQQASCLNDPTAQEYDMDYMYV